MTTVFHINKSLGQVICYGLLFGLVWSSEVYGRVDYRADLYAMGSKKGEKLFVLEHQTQSLENGHSEVTAVFSDLAGQVVFSEKAELSEGELVKTEVEQRQTGESGAIWVEKGRVYFRHKSGNGKEKLADEKLGSSLVVPANFNAWVTKNWETLSKGEVLEFRYGVWDRQETVGFKFFKISESEEGSDKVISFKMKASSFIIAALVDPLIFRYAEKGRRLVSYEGRVSPKKGNPKSGFKDLDADVVYTNY